MTLRRLNVIVWFAVLGGSLAWASQLVAGYQLGIARCSSPNERFTFSFHSWSMAFAVAAVLVALMSEVAAIFVFRATREAERLPVKRVHFLATVAIAVNPLVLAISAMTAVGTSLLSLCHQS